MPVVKATTTKGAEVYIEFLVASHKQVLLSLARGAKNKRQLAQACNLGERAVGNAIKYLLGKNHIARDDKAYDVGGDCVVIVLYNSVYKNVQDFKTIT